MILTIENIRTFNGHYDIDIEPITIIVGENSSGKTTLLASAAIVGEPRAFPMKPNFNLPPYELGNFNTIATSVRGNSPGKFSLGFSRGNKNKKSRYGVYATYQDFKGVPEILELKIEQKDSFLSINKSEDGYDIVAKIRNRDEITTSLTQRELDLSKVQWIDDLIFVIGRRFYSKIAEKERLEGDGRFFDEFIRSFHINVLRDQREQVSLSPIRSKPKRTYDEFKDDFSPDGNHIPFVLSNLLNDTSKKDEVIKKLREYGKDSGLFDDIKIKRLGRSHSDPFQIIVKSKGKESNITDVGYGVSQALPIIVECIIAGNGTRILMQQPEVHLHPRAQAALGSFIAFMNRNSNQHYIIETHSDYLIDRIKIEVSRGNIDHKDVVILYLEKDKNKTVVHQIKIDNLGETVDAPESYRKFFLEEQFRLLGVS